MSYFHYIEIDLLDYVYKLRSEKREMGIIIQFREKMTH